MTGPTPGLMIFHDGQPVEILHKVRDLSAIDERGGEVWRVRPLFVPGPDRDEVFQPGDRLTPLHTQHR